MSVTKQFGIVVMFAGVLAGCSSDEGNPLAVVTDPVADDPAPVADVEAVVENPLPSSATIFAMECFGNGVLAVCGDAGLAAILDNGTWRVLSTGTPARLTCLWGTSGSDVYFAGDGGCFLHWDGVALSPIDVGSSDWDGMWGDAATGEIWLVSLQTVVRWDASGTTRYKYPELPHTGFYYAIDGAGTDDVYIAGTSGNVAHWDGTFWTAVPGVAGDYLVSVEVVDGQVFAAAQTGELWRFDGTTWSLLFTAPTSFGFTVVRGNAADNVYAFGYSRLMYHWDGATWTDISDPYFSSTYAIQAACVGPNGGVAVGGAYSSVMPNVSRTLGSSWFPLSQSAITSETLNDVWVFDANRAFAVGQNGTIVQRDAAGWTDVPHGLTTEDLWSVWASGPDDIYAVGNNDVILRGDGVAWTLTDTGPDDFDLYGVGGNGPNNVWIIASEALWHWDGVAWTNRIAELPDPTADYGKVWVAPTGEVFLAGDDLVRWDGVAWERLPVKAEGGVYLYDLWGTSSSDVWMTGYPGVFHWDGTDATLRWLTGSDDPMAITGTGGRNVLAGGWGGVVQVADGIPAQVPAHLRGILGAGTGADGVSYFVGESGAIVRVE